MGADLNPHRGEIVIQDTLKSAQEQMDRTIDATREDFASVRT